MPYLWQSSLASAICSQAWSTGGCWLVCLLVGSIPAVLFGSVMAGKISGRWIQIALAIILIVAGLKILVWHSDRVEGVG